MIYVCTLRIACTQVGPQTSVLGQKARDNGFTVSLVARLHKLYKEKDLKKAAEPHQAAMLTNHRSHPSILCLPNSLFYHCSLQVSMHTNTEVTVQWLKRTNSCLLRNVHLLRIHHLCAYFEFYRLLLRTSYILTIRTPFILFAPLWMTSALVANGTRKRNTMSRLQRR